MSQLDRLSGPEVRAILPRIDVAGYRVLCLSSNIRNSDHIFWDKLTLTQGIAHEGAMVLGQVIQVNARKEMEYAHGGFHVDVPLSAGDFIVGVLANRHSSTSEYGDVPEGGISITEDYASSIDLLAAGGVFGICRGVPKALGDQPTRVRMVGILSSKEGRAIDILDTVPPWDTHLEQSAPIILSCGTAAEIGKTTTARQLIAELHRQGVENVAGTKVAGTGRRRDITTLAQAGAYPALDFPDVGLPTTYTSEARYLPAIYTLFNRINRAGAPDLILAECGGDIIEANIPTLLRSDIMKHVVAIVHSSTDVLSILGSLAIYRELGLKDSTPLYLTYPFTRNNVATVDRLRHHGVQLPIFDPLSHEECATVVGDILQKVHHMS